MKIARMVSAVVLTLLFAMNVSGGEGEQKKGQMPAFSDFDLNGDGTIVEQEFNEGHAKRMAERAAEGHQMKNAGKCTFAGVDADSDGGIAPEEFEAHKAKHMNKGHKKCKDKENCKHKHEHKHGEKQETQSET
jgi:hypothetical protein